ncbi:hypothetical protein MA16_Dca011370 [Dendrobium catenatum]|uniref:Uncharacterized protein n=1 Tax=Dendrobium catenatum TaxID=906689 RepID=A0A2I0WNX4_9ASPA|nr:hypothetical protein MA16_Dca011370 [Dendrobium catenatum]
MLDSSSSVGASNTWDPRLISSSSSGASRTWDLPHSLGATSSYSFGKTCEGTSKTFTIPITSLQLDPLTYTQELDSHPIPWYAIHNGRLLALGVDSLLSLLPNHLCILHLITTLSIRHPLTLSLEH